MKFGQYPVPIQTINEKGDIEETQGVHTYWRELWMPSIKDLQNMIAGRGVWLELHCVQLIPVAIFTTDENGQVEQPIFDENLKPE